MKREVGLWIDHRKAVIVTIENEVEDIRDRQFKDQLGNYYDGIISFIRGAEAIWIFGPGEAKVEFKSHLISEGLEGIIVGIDTVDKMTDNQISAKVRDHYLR